MNFQMKVMGFIFVCLGINVCARVLPISKVTIPEIPPIVSGGISPSLATANPDVLRQKYTQRPLFASKFDDDISETDTPKISREWSPLDYELIGVSRSNGRRTGWFRHNESGTLVSAHQGTHLGDWRLNRLSTTEAFLENNGEKLSLKLFIDEEPR